MDGNGRWAEERGLSRKDGTHAWASMNSGIITMVEDNIVDKLLEALKNIDENAEMLGLRAFVWNIEQCY